jgi:hypothetical protein
MRRPAAFFNGARLRDNNPRASGWRARHKTQERKARPKSINTKHSVSRAYKHSFCRFHPRGVQDEVI